MGTLGTYLATCFAFGIGAALSPCFYPMIPITVGFFMKQAEQRRVKVWLSAAVYGLTIVASFTIGGLILREGLSRLAGGVPNLILGAVLILLGLSLLGLFELPVPHWLVDWTSRGGQRKGLIGVVFMALALLVVGTPCIAPFWGPVLAEGKTVLHTTLGSLSFSLALALPFFLLALAPGLLNKLPKSGPWMHAVKVIMGFLLLGLSLKYLVSVDEAWQLGLFSRTGVLCLWSALALAAALYLFGILRLAEEAEDQRVSAVRLLLGTFVLTGALYLLSGIVQPLNGLVEGLLPEGKPALAAQSTQPAEKQLVWREVTFDDALALGRAENRPVFFDFTGEYCFACKLMERTMFPRAAVKERLSQMVLARLYTDRGKPQDDRNSQVLLDRFRTAGPPFYAVVTPDGKMLATFSGGTNSETDFVAFLDKALRRWKQKSS